VIDEHVAEEEAAEKRFNVPATSLEALSAIRRRCRDMEALFSDFHIGDVRMGVVEGGRGRWCGHLVVLQTCKQGVVVGLLPEYTRIKKTL